MKPEKQQESPLASDFDSRRDFLKTAGKLAVYTPPAMMMLMQPSRQALAGDSIQPGNFNHNGPGNLPESDWKYTDPITLDLAKIDQKQVDLAIADLKEIDWAKVDLKNVDWAKINWKSLDLGNMNLNLQKIDLQKIDWQKVEWQKIDWQKIKIDQDLPGKVLQFLSQYMAP